MSSGVTPIEDAREHFEKAGVDLTEDELREVRDVTDELANLIIQSYWAKHKAKKKQDALGTLKSPDANI